MQTDDDKPTVAMSCLLGGMVVIGMVILALAVVGVLALLRGWV